MEAFETMIIIMIIRLNSNLKIRIKSLVNRYLGEVHYVIDHHSKSASKTIEKKAEKTYK